MEEIFAGSKCCKSRERSCDFNKVTVTKPCENSKNQNVEI